MNFAQTGFCYFLIGIIGLISFVPVQNSGASIDLIFQQEFEGDDRELSVAEILNLSESNIVFRNLLPLHSLIPSIYRIFCFHKSFLLEDFKYVNAFQRNVFYINTFINAP